MGAKFDYDSLASTSVRLINKFGKSISKRTIINSGPEYNPTQTNVDSPIEGVIVAYGRNEADGTLILATDKKLLTTSSIDISDKIVDGEIVYSVVSIVVIQPADTILINKVQLRV